MIIKYCYDYVETKNGTMKKPFACVVGLKDGDKESIGYSICCPKDTFVKLNARTIATDRADVGDLSPFGPNPQLPIGVVNSYQFYQVGNTKYRWFGTMPKALVIEQAINFVRIRLCTKH